MQDRTINNALLELRKQAIRGSGEGLPHIEALLMLRGVALPRVLPPRKPNTAKWGVMPAIVLGALQSGPVKLREVAVCVHAKRPELEADEAYTRSALMLSELKRKGAVSREGRFWILKAYAARCQ